MKKIILVLILSGFAQSQNFWEQTNGPYGGSVLSFDENSMKKLFVGTQWDLVFVSDDFGLSWTHSDSGFINPYFTPSIDEIVINDSDHIFIGGYGTGVFRSLDDGISWEQLSNGMYRFDIFALTIDQNGFIYAGISDFGSLNVLRSTDNGESWLDKSNGLGYNDPTDFAIDDHNKIYAATYSDGVYYTEDQGENWFQSSLIGKYLLSIDISSEGSIFAGDWYGKVYRSLDGGVNWDTLAVTTDSILYITSINTDIPGYVFIGSGEDPLSSKGVFRSSDNGDSWVQVINELTDLNITSLFVDSELNLYAGAFYGSSFKSYDLGENWNQLGPPISIVNDLIIDESNIIFAGTEDEVYRSTNFGISWEYSSNGISGKGIQSLAYNNNGDIWAGARYYDGGIFHSTDKGVTWEGGTFNIIPTSILCDDSGYVYVSSFRKVYRTTDNGITWTILNSPDGVLLNITPDQTFYLGGLIVAGLYRSFDRGNNWIKIFDENTSVVYIDDSGNIFVGDESEPGGLYRSTDDGLSWEHCDSGLVSKKIRAINGMKNSGLYCAVGYGNQPGEYAYYVSYNNGQNWNEISLGIGASGVSLEFDSEGFLYAGTTGRAVFRSLATTTYIKSDEKLPLEYLLYQNYPNPFNPTTTIRYELPQDGQVTIEIFDILGQKVKTILNEFQRADRYEVTFSSTGLASGVYIYQLRVNDFITSKKMVLIK